MEAVILGAGEGSRMGDYLDLPKLFVQIGGKPIYQHQVAALDRYCDKITIMLGYGFEDSVTPSDVFDFPRSLTAEIEFRIIDDWDTYENGYTAMQALKEINDDVILVCGDVIFTRGVIGRVVEGFVTSHKEAGENTVGAVRGVQDEMTAVRLDEEGLVGEYGAIEGHQEVGLFLLNEDHISEAVSILEDNREYWFPVIFEEFPSRPVFVTEENRHEVNTRSHLEEARRKFS